MCVWNGASENVFCVNYEFIRHVGLDVLYRTQFSSCGHMHTHVGYHIEWKMCDMFYFFGEDEENFELGADGRGKKRKIFNVKKIGNSSTSESISNVSCTIFSFVMENDVGISNFFMLVSSCYLNANFTNIW